MENQREVWDSIAEEWNKYRKEEREVVEEFLKGKEGKLLDLGCGTGRNMINIPNVKWYCVDFSEKMLKHASINAGSNNIEAEFFNSEAHDLRFEDNFFDLVICHAVLHCIDTKEKRKKTIQEIYRVLRPNSQALISVWSKNSRVLKNKAKECYISWHSSPLEKRLRYTYVYDFNELKKDLEDVGFKIISSDENINLDFIVRK